MPIYQFECDACGRFDAMRSIADRNLPHLCPQCGTQTTRVVTSGAMLALMPQAQRAAHSTNERSAHAPVSSKAYGHRHGPGCGCGAAKSAKAGHAGSTRTFPGTRPWMISH